MTRAVASSVVLKQTNDLFLQRCQTAGLVPTCNSVHGNLLGCPAQVSIESLVCFSVSPLPLANARDFVLKPLLFSKQRENVLFDPLGEFRNAIGLQLHGYSACKHGNLLGCRGQGPIPDNPL